MRLRHLIYIPVVIIIGVIAFFSYHSIVFYKGPWQEAFITNGEKRIASLQVKFALKPEEKRKGLMYLPYIRKDHGLIFIFQRPVVINMWMKNTYASLDMVFFQFDGTISHIIEETRILSEKKLSSKVPALGIIELPAGTVKAYNIKVGHRLEWN